MNCFSSLGVSSAGTSCLRISVLVAEHRFEAGDVDNAHVPLLHIEQAVILELGEEAAYGFELDRDNCRSPRASCANETLRRVAAPREALRQVEQEDGEPLVCAHRAEQ